MATKKQKKIDIPQKDIESIMDMQMPSEKQMEFYRKDMMQEPVFNSPLDMQAHFDITTGAPYESKTPEKVEEQTDTDIQRRVQEEIDGLYPRTKYGYEGYLDSILRELIRARLSR